MGTSVPGTRIFEFKHEEMAELNRFLTLKLIQLFERDVESSSDRKNEGPLEC